MSGPFDDLIPGNKPATGSLAPRGGFIYTPPADSVGQQQKVATLGKAQTEAAIAAATQADQIAKAHAEAVKAQADAKNAEESTGGAWGDPNLTGQARLASVPADKRTLVQLMVNNQIPNLGGFALKSPEILSAISTAKAVNPDFDMSLMPVRFQAMKDFSGGGKMSQAVGAVNRLAANLEELKAISDKMGGPDTGIAPLNKVIAGTEQQFEPGLKARYNALLPEIANQFDLIMKSNKGSPTVSGTAEVTKGLDPARSQAERDAAFQEVAKAVHGAIEPIKDQWDSAYGGTRAPPMWISPQAGAFFSKIDPAHADDYGGKDWRGLPGLNGAGDQPTPPPPSLGGGTPPPPAAGPPSLGPQGKPPGGPVLGPDLSSFADHGEQGIATMDYNSPYGVFAPSTRTVVDPNASGALDALAHKGASYSDAVAYLKSNGFNPAVTPQQWSRYVSYVGQHPNYSNVQVEKSVPTTLGERIASSPGASFLAGAGAAGTAGLDDVLGRKLFGPEWDQRRQALAALNPSADIAGNVAGGVAGLAGGEALAAKYAPGALGFAASKLGKFAPVAGDLAYGGTYGANEDPNDPMGGLVKGGLASVLGGAIGRNAVRGLSAAIAPAAGNYAPLYAAGVFPTIGQRLAGSTAFGGVPGRAANFVEQALQSVPLLGAAPATARQATRDSFQTGAFNNALNELQPFAKYGVPTKLPDGMGPGTEAHNFAVDQFNTAYPMARSGMQFVPDPQYMQEANALAQKVNSGVLSPDQAQQVSNVVNNAVVGRLKSAGGTLNGAQYQAAGTDLDNAIRTWGKNPNTAPMADALSDYQTIFDNAARRNSDQNSVNMLDAADRGYAQLVRIQRASELGGAAKDAGTFTPANYAGAVKQMGGGVRSNAYNQGNALGQDYAQAGLNLNDRLADSGTPTRLGVLGALQGAEGAGLAATHSLGALASPGALAVFAPYAPVIRGLVNRAIAPRQYVLPPNFAAPLVSLGAKVNQLAPVGGNLAAAYALPQYAGINQ